MWVTYLNNTKNAVCLRIECKQTCHIECCYREIILNMYMFQERVYKKAYAYYSILSSICIYVCDCI